MIFKNLRFTIINLCFYILALLPTLSVSQDASLFKWQAGEELEYNVTWSFFDLGQVTLFNLGKTEINGYSVNHIRMEILSNPLLFWLDHKSVYSSYITDDLKVIRYISAENIDGVAYNGQYDFDYENNKIKLTLFHKENPGKIEHKEFLLKPKLYDGLSLIQYARANSMEMKKDTASTFIEDVAGDVLFDFSLSKHLIEVETKPDGIKTIYFSGEILITGIAGMTGPFETWYSDDSARVPVLAFMEVFVGRVKIELSKWKFWTPKK